MRRLVALGQLIALLLLAGANSSEAHGREKLFLTNEGFQKAIRGNLDLFDERAVFRFVFSALIDEITIYPTENYYYFEFFAAGTKIAGNLALLADARDDGRIGFAYRELSNVTKGTAIDRAVTFDRRDGVDLTKQSEFTYSIAFEGRTVVAHLNPVRPQIPRKAKLLDSELYVGTSCDESGLRFHLLYNREGRRLYWILDEDDSVPENFVNYSSDIAIGRRTEFAFFKDVENRRMVLIGVQKQNALANNWYDGPFDQLPDNYILNGQVQLLEYLEESYPASKGLIDKYGVYIADRDSRIAVASYLIYSDPKQLSKRVNKYRNRKGTAAFYGGITSPGVK